MPRKFCNRLNGFLIVEHAGSCRHHLTHRNVSTTCLTAQKPFVFKIRIDGKDRRITLAAYPDMSLLKPIPRNCTLTTMVSLARHPHLARIELSEHDIIKRAV